MCTNSPSFLGFLPPSTPPLRVSTERWAELRSVDEVSTGYLHTVEYTLHHYSPSSSHLHSPHVSSSLFFFSFLGDFGFPSLQW